MYGDDTIDLGMSAGPMMEGTWYNPQNGDSFTVKDTYFEGDQLFIIAMDGRRYNGDMVTNYIQTDGPLPSKPEIDPNQGRIDINQLLAGADKDMMGEVNGLIGKTTTVQPVDPLNQVIGEKPEYKTDEEQHQQEPTDEDGLLLKRLLGKVEMPKVTCSIKWTKFPAKQLEMLDMLGVSEEKVTEYLVNKLDLDDIYRQVGQSLIKYISDSKEKESKKTK